MSKVGLKSSGLGRSILLVGICGAGCFTLGFLTSRYMTKNAQKKNQSTNTNFDPVPIMINEGLALARLELEQLRIQQSNIEQLQKQEQELQELREIQNKKQETERNEKDKANEETPQLPVSFSVRKIVDYIEEGDDLEFSGTFNPVYINPPGHSTVVLSDELSLQHTELRRMVSDYLSEIECVKIVRNAQLIEIQHSLRIEDALSILMRNNIRCCSVFKPGRRWRSRSTIGFMTVWSANSALMGQETYEPDTLRVHQALSKCVTTFHNSFIMEAIKHMKQGHHHVGIRNDRGDIYAILSQGDVIKCIYDGLLGLEGPESTVLEQTIRELGIQATGDLHVVRDDCNTRESFQMMAKHCVASLPIVDTDGRIKDVISASDIRLLGLPLGSTVSDMLTHRASEFSNTCRNSVKSHYKNDFKHKVVTCTLDTTLAQALELIHEYHIHQLYIVDENDLPIGHLSLLDLLHIMC